MSSIVDKPRRGPRRLLPLLMVGLTAAACVTALVFRTHLRGRYWAARLAETDDPAERALLVTALCNAGEAGHWGTAVLLDSERAELRQLGAVVLHHTRTAWGRERLMALLSDEDEATRELAALGLALYGDESVIPSLQTLYREAAPATAQAACLALARLATPACVTALAELADAPADADRRAALVDALAVIGQPECVPPLLELLGDQRTAALPPHAARALEALREGRAGPTTTSAPASAATKTVAERAAAALQRITGLTPPFSAALSAEQQEAAQRQWRAWYEQKRTLP